MRVVYFLSVKVADAEKILDKQMVVENLVGRGFEVERAHVHKMYGVTRAKTNRGGAF